MGMIRVSDDAERKIKEMANGRTISATVDAILAGGAGGADFKEYLDKKFDELKELIEDTTVDRVSGYSGGRSFSREKEYLDWPVAQYILYEVCDEENAPEWVSKTIHNIVDQWNDEFVIYVQDGFLWVQREYGSDKLLRVSDRVRAAIDSASDSIDI